ncbi:MAG TPA: Hsp20/alpha crystallin family protein [Methanocella sp.]|jgi:HSP20 family protein
MADYEMDPFDELKRIQHRLGQMLRGRPEKMEVMRPGTVTIPDVDVEERGNDIIVTADMPGVDKSDIRINVTEDNVLEISAEKKAEEKKEEQGYIRHERSYSRYYRAIRLPVPVDKTKAKASYNNGVLDVTMPMIHKTSASEIPIS